MHQHQHQEKGQLHGRFAAGIAINAAFVAVELGFGIATGSLALISDAGHNLSDVFTLLLSMLAIRLSKRKATARYTFGYQRATILASLVNSVILVTAVIAIGWEAVQRFTHPQPTNGVTVTWVAAAGIAVNAGSALLFFRHRHNELNARGAWLHLVADTLVSVAVLVAGIIISFTGWMWVDPAISLLVVAALLYSTWDLLRESVRLSLDAVPAGIDSDKICALIAKHPDVKRVHHLHIWAMGTQRNALTAHIVLRKGSEDTAQQTKETLRQWLEDERIQHATLETEIENES